MESRDLYKQKYEAQLHEWAAKIDLMKAQSEKLAVQAKLEIKPRLDDLHTQFERVKSKLGEIADTAEEKWNGVAKEVDKAWDEFKASADGAYDALKPK